MNDYPAGTYNKVLILTKPNPDEVTNYIGSEVVKFCEENDVKWSFTPAMYKDDSERLMIVAIGGDGTMLGAMRLSLELEGSFVYGINTGSLGFLSENISCINGITKIFSNIGRGFGVMEERMALTAEVSMDGEILARDLDAMNEFVLAPMTIQSPLVTEVFINDKFVSSNQGSGVLVASSTGSTAMALSGGGAIVSPSTNIMQIVPIMAHTLTSRPIITTGRDTITLKATVHDEKRPVEIYGDGIYLASSQDFGTGTIEVTIAKHPTTVKVYRPESWDFFNVLREKMKW